MENHYETVSDISYARSFRVDIAGPGVIEQKKQCIQCSWGCHRDKRGSDRTDGISRYRPVDIIPADFPMTQDALNLASIGDGGLVYETQMSINDVMKFYRAAYAAKGYVERKELTTVSEGNFKMAFDGDPSGQAVVVRSEDLGDGSLLITVRLEDV